MYSGNGSMPVKYRCRAVGPYWLFFYSLMPI